MMCKPCGNGQHAACRWPVSCPCHHRDPAAELVAETAADDRVERARILAGGPVRDEWIGARRSWAALLAPQTGPLVRVISSE